MGFKIDSFKVEDFRGTKKESKGDGSMVGIAKAVVGMVAIGAVLVLAWRYKWYILGASLVYVLVLMACNYYYRKATGKNMRIYDRMMK